VVLVVCSAFRKDTRMTWDKLVKVARASGKGITVVALACGMAGIVTDIINLTGSGVTLSTVLVDIAAGNMPVLLILTMIAALVLGMGLPATPCYIILAVVAAPALVSLNVPNIASHMFVYYFGCLCAITPPVAIAAYVAAGIAKTSPMDIGWTAWRISFPVYFLPFVWCWDPGLLAIGSIADIVMISIFTLTASFAMAVGIYGYWVINLNIPLRAVAVVTALVLFYPTATYVNILGVVVFLILAAYVVYKKRTYRVLASATMEVLDK
jgi:TRAP-type uncharacterized transport system fused permease subunit